MSTVRYRLVRTPLILFMLAIAVVLALDWRRACGQRLRFGSTTREPVPPFGSSVPAPWTTLTSAHRTFMFSKQPGVTLLPGAKAVPECYDVDEVWSAAPWNAAAKCGEKHGRRSSRYGLFVAVA